MHFAASATLLCWPQRFCALVSRARWPRLGRDLQGRWPGPQAGVTPERDDTSGAALTPLSFLHGLAKNVPVARLPLQPLIRGINSSTCSSARSSCRVCLRTLTTPQPSRCTTRTPISAGTSRPTDGSITVTSAAGWSRRPTHRATSLKLTQHGIETLTAKARIAVKPALHLLSRLAVLHAADALKPQNKPNSILVMPDDIHVHCLRT